MKTIDFPIFISPPYINPSQHRTTSFPHTPILILPPLTILPPSPLPPPSTPLPFLPHFSFPLPSCPDISTPPLLYPLPSSLFHPFLLSSFLPSIHHHTFFLFLRSPSNTENTKNSWYSIEIIDKNMREKWGIREGR